MSGEIEFLREHLKDICQYKGLQGELTYDVSFEILWRICKVLDFLRQENEQLKKELAVLKMSEEEWLEETIGREDNEWIL